MHYETFFHDRVKLYNEVWADPVTTVAKQYGISDVALHKLCKRLEIPIPPPGYWAKVKAGKKVDKPALPQLSDPKKILGRRRIPDPKDTLIEERLNEMGRPISTNEQLQVLCANITVKKHLVNPHPLVLAAGEYLKERKSSSNSAWLHTSSEMLDIAISRSQLERSLRIYDALIKTLEELGFAVLPNKTIKSRWGRIDNGTFVQIGDQFLKIKLTESSGKLTLNIDEYWANRKNWSDGKRKTIEQQLGNFILSLVKTAEEKQVRNKIEEQQEQQRIQEEKRGRELQELRDKEIKRFHDLEKAAQEWQRAQNIDRYIEAVRAAMEEQPLDIEQKEKLEEWIKWAKGKVEWLNPLTSKNDPILGEKHK